MKKLRTCILLLSISAASAAIANQPVVTAPRGYVSTAYHNTYDKLSGHKGKVGLVVGAVGCAVVNKVFAVEIEKYVKPFFKSVYNKFYNFFRRVFRGDKYRADKEKESNL